jgi:hypothetical protein
LLSPLTFEFNSVHKNENEKLENENEKVSTHFSFQHFETKIDHSSIISNTNNKDIPQV